MRLCENDIEDKQIFWTLSILSGQLWIQHSSWSTHQEVKEAAAPLRVAGKKISITKMQMHRGSEVVVSEANS